MYNSIAHPARGGAWRLAAVFGALLLLALLVGALVASADTVPGVTGVTCMEPANKFPCTAGDVRIARMFVTNVPACLADPAHGGDLYADVVVRSEVTTTSTSRYDIGLWVALAGGSAHTGPGNQCYHGILRPLETITTPFHADGGPYRDLDGDYCGDTHDSAQPPKGDGSVFAYIQELHIKCTNTSGTGLMDRISTCTSWDNNEGTTCSKIEEAVPGNGAKCDCSTTPITPSIPISQIVVRKVTDPITDTTTIFNFTAHGPGLKTNPTTFTLTGGKSWASGYLPSGGTYSVTEDLPLPFGWSLGNFNCTDGTTSYNPASFTMPEGKTVECTFTNSKRVDWGDLPYGTVFGQTGFTWTAMYSTTLAQDGPRHALYPDANNDGKPEAVAGKPPAIWLGALVDSEPDGIPSDLANGDDIALPFDDEDGITLNNPESWHAGVTNGGSLKATFSSSSAGSNSGYLVVWFDWNHDGKFSAGEAAVNTAVTWSGTTSAPQTFSFTVPFCQPDPNNCDPGHGALDAPLFYRARLFASAPATPAVAWIGGAVNGEVEDYRVDPRLAVDLLRFEATGGKRRITLAWETASEVNNLGFNLYRATKVHGERTKLNDEPIPTLVPPGSGLGAVYKWTDTTVRGARVYYYWLENVDISGSTGLRSTDLHGPVSARAK